MVLCVSEVLLLWNNERKNERDEIVNNNRQVLSQDANTTARKSIGLLRKRTGEKCKKRKHIQSIQTNVRAVANGVRMPKRNKEDVSAYTPARVHIRDYSFCAWLKSLRNRDFQWTTQVECKEFQKVGTF